MSPETPAEKLARLEQRVNYLELSLPPILESIKNFQKFWDQHETKEEIMAQQQVERHEENKAKLDELNTSLARKSFWVNVAAFMVGVASLAIAILAIVVMVKLANHSMSDMLHIFVSHQPYLTEMVNSSIPIHP